MTVALIPGVLNADQCARLSRELRLEPGERTEPWADAERTERVHTPEFAKSKTAYATTPNQRHMRERIASFRYLVSLVIGSRDLLVLNPELHFLTYGEGDYIRLHVDGTTDEARAVIFSIALNDDYEGGAFNLPDFGKVRIPVGSMLAFTPEHAHSVHTITSGVRFAISGWFNNKEVEMDTPRSPLEALRRKRDELPVGHPQRVAIEDEIRDIEQIHPGVRPF